VGASADLHTPVKVARTVGEITVVTQVGNDVEIVDTDYFVTSIAEVPNRTTPHPNQPPNGHHNQPNNTNQYEFSHTT
jgi:hypothetical protein